MNQAAQITRELVRAASCRPGPVASAAFTKIRACLTPFRRRLLSQYRGVQDLEAILDEALLRAVDSCQSGNTTYLLRALENAALGAAQSSRGKAALAVNPFPSARVEKRLLDTQLPAEETPESLLSAEERRRAIRSAVNDDPSRKILRLRYWEARTQAETASLSRLHRLTVLRLEAVALARLKKLLAHDEQRRTPRQAALIHLISSAGAGP